MAIDFKASQVRTTQIIASGSDPLKPALLIISASSDDVDNEGGGYNSDTLLSKVGRDTFLFISGSKSSKNTATKGVTVLGGDVVISGTLYNGVGTAYVPGGGGGGGGTPGGDPTNVQYNSAGSFGGDNGLTYDSTNADLTVGRNVQAKRYNVGGTTAFVSSSDGSSLDLGSTTQVLVMSGGASTSTDPRSQTDTNFFVSGTIGSRGTATKGTSVFGGDLYTSGVIHAIHGFTGSLTKLADNSAYIIPGTGIQTVTGANGAITISNTILGPDVDANFLVLSPISSLNNERVFHIGTGLTGTDAGAGGNFTVAINDAVVATVSGTTFTGVVKANVGLSGSLTKLTDGTSYLIAGTSTSITTGANGAVTINSAVPQYFSSTTAGSIFTSGAVAFRDQEFTVVAPSNKGADNFFYVSGAIGSRGGVTAGVALFGGDTVVSGTVYGLGDTRLNNLHVSGTTKIGDSSSNSLVVSSTAYFRNVVDVGNPVFSGTIGSGTGSLIVRGGPTLSTDIGIGSKNIVLFGTGAYGVGAGIEFSDGAVGLVEESYGYLRIKSVKLMLSTSVGANCGVGINQSYPTADLDVSGTAKISSRLSVANILDVSGNVNLIGNSVVIGDSIYTDTLTVNSPSTFNDELRVSGSVFLGNGSFTTRQVLILSGGGSGLSPDPKNFSDTNFQVAGIPGSKGSSTYRGTSVFGGDVVISGTLYDASGTPYVTSGSGGGGTSYFSSVYAGSIFTTASVAFAGQSGIQQPSTLGSNVTFFVSGSKGSAYYSTSGTALFGGDLVTSGDIYSRKLYVVDPAISSSSLFVQNGYFSFILGQYANVNFSDYDGISQLVIDDDSKTVSIGSDAPGVGGTDTYFSVSGTIGSKQNSVKGTSVFGGDVVTSGTLYSLHGITGSLTNLSDGSSYLIAGTNISLVTESNGAVTISTSGFSGITGTFNDLTSRLATSASLSIAGNLGPGYFANNAGSDVFFFVSGSSDAKRFNTSSVAVFGGDLVVTGALYTETSFILSSSGMSWFDASVGSVSAAVSTERGVVFRDAYTSKSYFQVNADGGTVEIGSNTEAVGIGSDTFFFVSGAIGGKDGGSRNVAVFGGDTVTSGTILPGLDLATDLGSATNRFRNIYTGDLHLKNDRGDYTLIEEEDCLTIRFNNSGKRYRFLLERAPEYDE